MNKKRVLSWIVHAVLLPVDYLVSGFAWQHPGMTISSRCGLAMLGKEAGWKGFSLRLLGHWLGKLDRNHCIDAIAGDLARIERTRAKLAPWAPKTDAD